MPSHPATCFGLVVSLLFSTVVCAADQDQLKVGVQPDGRIVVPTNQILAPAGKQVTFPGRPVDLALAEEGKILVIKNMSDLVFIDVATAKIKQTLKSPIGFSAIGLLVLDGDVWASDGANEVRIARRQKDGLYAWIAGTPLLKPGIGGVAYPTGLCAAAARTALGRLQPGQQRATGQPGDRRGGPGGIGRRGSLRRLLPRFRAAATSATGAATRPPRAMHKRRLPGRRSVSIRAPALPILARSRSSKLRPANGGRARPLLSACTPAA